MVLGLTDLGASVEPPHCHCQGEILSLAPGRYRQTLAQSRVEYLSSVLCITHLLAVSPVTATV